MPVIKLQHVVSCSSEDVTHKADNLLKPETYRKWKCADNAERHASIILQFEKASQIHSIDVGNESSAFVEILVGHSTSTSSDDYQVILVTSSFMSPMDSKNGIHTNRVRMFSADKLSKAVLDKKWDRVKIVCSQPFNKLISYGLSFVKFHSPQDEEDSSTSHQPQSAPKLGMFKLKEDSKSSVITPGSFFKQRSMTKAEPAALTGAAAVRAAATVAAASLTSTVTTSQASAATATANMSRTPQRTSAPTTTPHRHPDTKGDTTPKTTQKRRLSDDDEAASTRGAKKTAAGRRNSADREEAGTKAPPTKKSKDEAPRPKRKSKPFERLMEGVTFVLSGFQNPLRGDLREKAMEMGAKYRPDWGSGCTHLICAFANTPKFNQVRGKGKIVTKGWILDSYRKKTLHSWGRYSMLSTSDDSSSYEEESESDEEEDDDWERRRRRKPAPQKAMPKKATPQKATPKSAMPKADDQCQDDAVPLTSVAAEGASTSKPAADNEDDCSTTDVASDAENVIKPVSTRHNRSSSGDDTEDELRRIRDKKAGPKPDQKDGYLSSTDDETDTQILEESGNPSNLPGIPDLPDFFAEKVFFLYGKFDAEERRQITRLIITFEGAVEEYMTDRVAFVVTNSAWDENFDKASDDHCDISFVRPKWIYACAEKSKLVPYQPYVIVPS